MAFSRSLGSENMLLCTCYFMWMRKALALSLTAICGPVTFDRELLRGNTSGRENLIRPTKHSPATTKKNICQPEHNIPTSV